MYVCFPVSKCFYWLDWMTNTGDRIQSPVHAKHVFYHWTIHPALSWSFFFLAWNAGWLIRHDIPLKKPYCFSSGKLSSAYLFHHLSNMEEFSIYLTRFTVNYLLSHLISSLYLPRHTWWTSPALASVLWETSFFPEATSFTLPVSHAGFFLSFFFSFPPSSWSFWCLVHIYLGFQ